MEYKFEIGESFYNKKGVQLEIYSRFIHEHTGEPCYCYRPKNEEFIKSMWHSSWGTEAYIIECRKGKYHND